MASCSAHLLRVVNLLLAVCFLNELALFCQSCQNLGDGLNMAGHKEKIFAVTPFDHNAKIVSSPGSARFRLLTRMLAYRLAIGLMQI